MMQIMILMVNRSYEWERSAINLLSSLNNSKQFGPISIYYTAESSLGEEMDSLIWHVLPLLGATGAVVLAAAAACGWSPNKMERNVWFGVAGTATAALGTAAGMGLVFYCGVEMVIGGMATPFLILGKHNLFCLQ
jgi:hypothetical protein